MAHKVVDGGVKVIRHALQDLDLRLGVVVFLFVDGGLGHEYPVGKILLADAILLPQRFQVFQHPLSPLFLPYFNNQREFYKIPNRG